ncbi:MAG TPA: FMN-binding protein [Chloroflexota bacterium]|nr:FMN-binding protein [Chloroflexota bacterium]
MKRSFLGRAFPSALTAAGVAVPSATAGLVMLHAMLAGSAAPSASVSSSSGSSASPTPTGAPATPPTNPAATATPQPTVATTRTITGASVADRYGAVQATITVKGKKITGVSISAPEGDPRSASINQQAVPMLQSETLQAQSATINVISGATETSDAYIQSLQGALKNARL